MYAEVIRGVVVRPLRNGDTEVVQSVFDRLGPRSRLLRFGGVKNVLTPGDLNRLACVDANHHVVVGYVGGVPVGIARLARIDREVAEVAVEVVDEWQHRGIGKILMTRLADDARLAGIERLEATVDLDNTASRRLLRSVGVTLVPCASSSQAQAA